MFLPGFFAAPPDSDTAWRHLAGLYWRHRTTVKNEAHAHLDSRARCYRGFSCGRGGSHDTRGPRLLTRETDHADR